MVKSEIGYLRENIARDYAASIRKCLTVKRLRAVLALVWPYCTDAIEQARTMSDADWKFVRENARVEKYGMRINELGGHILLPSVLLRMSEITRAYHCTDGTALLRLLDAPPPAREEPPQ
jgi:hypothetical protein